MQLFKGREGQTGPLDTLASDENAAIEDTRSVQEQSYERASEELSISQTELARLRTEYLALAEKIRMAEGALSTRIASTAQPEVQIPSWPYELTPL